MSSAADGQPAPTTRRLRIDDAELTCLELPGEGPPGAAHWLAPDAGHHPHMENPAVWLAAMRAHLARVAR